MGEERLTRAESIFQAAADLPPGDRETLLTDRCGNDPELRRMVERLLARHDEGMGSFLEPDASRTRIETEEEEPPPPGSERIGPYILRERLGAGGMGEVWKAEQTEPVRRTVALKLIKVGMDSAQLLARFEAERQALALMDHPYIAKVHDAGVTKRGRPYFVMEHVAGVPITDYCDQRRLDTKERLELFEKVCEGVQHAHQKAVIHRDLKPTNILVADVDEKPLPKIIDFGVAKATTQQLTDKSMHTALGQVIGTPEYMSPEQADLTNEDVDTRTDVYSLGVVLYELLVGALPFESDELRKAGPEGMLRTLREKDPPRPSTKIATLGHLRTGVAKCRRTEPGRLLRQLRGDLDWIVMRALEKDPNRRYASPRELAQDVQRHLGHQPVQAGPPSILYRTRKFVRRHRVGAGVTAVALLVAIAGFVAVSVQKAEIKAARDEAALVISTLEEMLESVDPTKSGRDVTVKEMLDETAGTLDARFSGQPLVKAKLQNTVGRTYFELGEYEAAEKHLHAAAATLDRELGEEHARTIEARLALTRVWREMGKHKEAETLARKTLETSRRVFGPSHPQIPRSMTALGEVLWRQERYSEATAILREALEIQSDLVGARHPETLATAGTLASVYMEQGRYEQAGPLLRETLGNQRHVLGKEHPRTLTTMRYLASWHWYQKRFDEAEALDREVLAIQRRVLGDEHPSTLGAMFNLAFSHQAQGRRDEATTLWQETLAIERRVLGEEHPETLKTMGALASSWAAQGRYEEAEELVREALKISVRVHGDNDPSTNTRRYDLAGIEASRGRRDDAIRLLKEILKRGFRDGHMSILDDPMFASLHGDPEFDAVVDELARRNEQSQETATNAK